MHTPLLLFLLPFLFFLNSCKSFFDLDPYHKTLPPITKSYFFYDQNIKYIPTQKKNEKYVVPSLTPQPATAYHTNLLLLYQYRNSITYLKEIEKNVNLKKYDYRLYLYVPQAKKVIGYTNNSLSNVTLSFYRIWHPPAKKFNTGHIYLSNIDSKRWYAKIFLTNFSTKSEEKLDINRIIYKGKIDAGKMLAE